MGIKLSLDVETPLTDDDHDILAGISVTGTTPRSSGGALPPIAD